MKKVFIFKEAEKVLLYICGGGWALFALAAIGSYILHPELGIERSLEGLIGITLGISIVFVIFKALFLTGVIGGRTILTDDELIYRRKHIPLDKIRHLRIVVKEQKFGAELRFEILYGKEKKLFIRIAQSGFFFPLYSGFPPEFVKELIKLRGEKGVSQEVFEFIETGTVKKWEEYLKRTGAKHQAALLFVLFLSFSSLSIIASKIGRIMGSVLAFICLTGFIIISLKALIKKTS